MSTIRRCIATIELLLIFPGALFMLALFLREVQPPPFEPAQTARHIVDWYAARPRVGLQIFLMALPFAAFVIGCTSVFRGWRTDAQLRDAAHQTVNAIRAHLASLVIAAATLIAGGILAVVFMHLITD
jgi:hypothetical protein